MTARIVKLLKKSSKWKNRKKKVFYLVDIILKTFIFDIRTFNKIATNFQGIKYQRK